MLLRGSNFRRASHHPTKRRPGAVRGEREWKSQFKHPRWKVETCRLTGINKEATRSASRTKASHITPAKNTAWDHVEVMDL
jgi:hypothetical protein